MTTAEDPLFTSSYLFTLIMHTSCDSLQCLHPLEQGVHRGETRHAKLESVDDRTSSVEKLSPLSFLLTEMSRSTGVTVSSESRVFVRNVSLFFPPEAHKFTSRSPANSEYSGQRCNRSQQKLYYQLRAHKVEAESLVRHTHTQQ